MLGAALTITQTIITAKFVHSTSPAAHVASSVSSLLATMLRRGKHQYTSKNRPRIAC